MKLRTAVKIGSVLLLTVLGGSAMAATNEKCTRFLAGEICTPVDPPHPTPVAAPEIDPAAAVAGLTLLAGGLAVLRGRRVKR